MKRSSIADYLWGDKARFSYLLLAAILLLFTLLGDREIWTQEHRWADIVYGMFYRQDFLHPYLGEMDYYDKPLLSYWLIVLFAKLAHALTTWSLRLPSALAGLLAIWSIYRLGSALKDKHLGLLAGWLLLTTFYFVFWARTSSADMLNLAGSLFAIAWYIEHRHKTRFLAYAVFFIILALTSLCKGLIGFIVPLIAVLTDVFLQKSWKQHLRLPLFLAMLPAFTIYLLPFAASSYFSNEAYGENGLYLVYRENFLRYFQPFDHQGPIYTYLLYLPIYLLPSAIFFLPALIALKSRWKIMSDNSKWITLTLLLLFLFFTLSGSRRSYYVLPMVPFAILFTADWLLSSTTSFARLRNFSASLIIFSFILLFIVIDVMPAWYYSQFGVNRFANVLKQEANQIKPWNTWNIVLLDAESKINFYLQLPPTIENYHVKGTERSFQTSETLKKAWPILENKPANTIFISRKLYSKALQEFFIGYHEIKLPSQTSWPFMKKQETDAPIAFIPKH
jgi:4-amino-4-deoxy-L-arabinose transferase-like glycosyltransferase